MAIETGRYAKPIATPIDKRLCFHCKQVENEYHLIFECSLYNSERKSLYDDLSNILSIDIRPSNETLYLLMSCLHGDPDVGRSFCNFINKCFTIRSEILCYKKELDIFQRNKPTVTRSGRSSKRPVILDL